ncbi:unnamed protein product [Paramecium octaurelia]|uniref:Peptide methionine sulphoxide reductase MsrA domain-containing protein n=1 Tax=Paramecium octaurelia TaxID=43137 RepID=A0A8S1VC65_PAROT|nr:unnamed protein product [Paramecium octaurelia]
MNIINKATLGGGCFWCIEAVYRRIQGVTEVYSGYSGGALKSTANYKDVCKGNTGHAEVVQVLFDQNKVDYKDLLYIFFASHDPTTLNRQGNDEGEQYRSIIFYHNEQQKAMVNEVIKEVQKEYKNPIVTQVVEFKEFYKAEDYHQGYYDSNPNEGYCRAVISPKIKKIIQKYQTSLKPEFQ